MDPETQPLLRHRAQGFSHVGLINTAYNPVKAHSGPARQRSEGKPASRSKQQ